MKFIQTTHISRIMKKRQLYLIMLPKDTLNKLKKKKKKKKKKNLIIYIIYIEI